MVAILILNVIILVGLLIILFKWWGAYKEGQDSIKEFITSSNKHLLDTSLSVKEFYTKLDNFKDMTVIHSLQDDRDHLLLLMARSFHAANKLLLEKKHPSSDTIILVFQMKNGNIRFSIKESILPDYIKTPVIRINNEKINYRKNYQLIDELINDHHE